MSRQFLLSAGSRPSPSQSNHGLTSFPGRLQLSPGTYVADGARISTTRQAKPHRLPQDLFSRRKRLRSLAPNPRVPDTPAADPREAKTQAAPGGYSGQPRPDPRPSHSGDSGRKPPGRRRLPRPLWVFPAALLPLVGCTVAAPRRQGHTTEKQILYPMVTQVKSRTGGQGPPSARRLLVASHLRRRR